MTHSFSIGETTKEVLGYFEAIPRGRITLGKEFHLCGVEMDMVPELAQIVSCNIEEQS